MKSPILLVAASGVLWGAMAPSADVISDPAEAPLFSTPPSAPDRADPDSDPIIAVSNDIPDVQGRWLKQVVTVADTSAGPIGTVRIEATVTSIVDVHQQGRDLALVVDTCSTDMTSDSSMVRTRFSDRFVHSIDDQIRSARLIRRNGQWFVNIERKWELLGVTMDAPEDESLPDDADDPRVFDQDGDGNPGFTIEVDGLISGQAYVARRAWDQFLGQLNGDGTVEGRVKWDAEQKVLDASRRTLRSSPDTDPVVEAGGFRMKSVDDDVGCQTVRSGDASFRD